MRLISLAILGAVATHAWEPEAEAYLARRELQSHSSGGHSSGGHSSGGHTSRVRAPDKTKTGCTPPKGSDTPKTTASTPDAANEPCYVHDSACDGYPVCCVKQGTCISTHGGMVSSNAAYYQGGCTSTDSSKKTLPEGCAKAGECHAMYLEHMKGGTTKAGNDVSPDVYTVEVMMTGADKCEAYYTPPIPIYGFVLIGVGALVVLLCVVGLIVKVACKKAPAAKGAPDNAEATA